MQISSIFSNTSHFLQEEAHVLKDGLLQLGNAIRVIVNKVIEVISHFFGRLFSTFSDEVIDMEDGWSLYSVDDARSLSSTDITSNCANVCFCKITHCGCGKMSA